MKKNIEKIHSSAGLIIALVLIVILIVTAFGGIKDSEFDNQLVRGLVITLSVLYLVLAVSSLTLLFLGSDAVREITLRSEQGGNCKATLSVIRKLVKETFYGIEGVKIGKVSLIVNEYGVKLKVSVRITDRDVFETETYLRALLEEVFRGALGFRFHAIEFKIVSLQARFKPDKEKVNAEVAEKVAAHTANYAALPNLVEQMSATDSAAEATEEVAVQEQPADESVGDDVMTAPVEQSAETATEAEEETVEAAEDEADAAEEAAEETETADDGESDEAPEQTEEYGEEEKITEGKADAEDADVENE